MGPLTFFASRWSGPGAQQEKRGRYGGGGQDAEDASAAAWVECVRTAQRHPQFALAMLSGDMGMLPALEHGRRVVRHGCNGLYRALMYALSAWCTRCSLGMSRRRGARRASS